MDFGISEEQRDIQELARKILGDLATPVRLAAYDNYASERFDEELWRQLAEAGLLGLAVPEEFGGMGFGFMELALLSEEIGRTIAPVPVLSHLLGGVLPICLFGSAEQKQRLLPGAVSGEQLLSAALEEDAAVSVTTARAEAGRVGGRRGQPVPRKRHILNDAENFGTAHMAHAPARARRCTFRAIGSNNAVEHRARLVQRGSFAYQVPTAFHLARHAEVHRKAVAFPIIVIRHFLRPPIRCLRPRPLHVAPHRAASCRS